MIDADRFYQMQFVNMIAAESIARKLFCCTKIGGGIKLLFKLMEMENVRFLDRERLLSRVRKKSVHS